MARNWQGQPKTEMSNFAYTETFAGDTAILENDEFRHQAVVMRRRVGDRIRLLDGRGGVCDGRVELIDSRKRILKAVIIEREVRPRPLPLQLLVALPGKNKFDGIIQKATELGATRIIPLLSARTIVKSAARGDRVDKRREHWRKVAIAACKQSGNPFLPEIDVPVELAALNETELDDGFRNDETDRIIFHPPLSGLVSRPLRELALREDSPTRLAFGPEGGFSDSEIGLFQERGYSLAGLGRRILRLETAITVALALVQEYKRNL